MKETLRITIVLTSVCIICAFLLAFVFNSAKDKIEENAKKRINESIFKLAPLADKADEISVKGERVYKLLSNKNQVMGYAFLADGQGYQGKIKILAVSDSFINKLSGIEIIDSAETPGLGAKIQEDFFKSQFKNLTVLPKIGYVKDTVRQPNQIQAITGATISSKAVVNILNQKVLELKHNLIK